VVAVVLNWNGTADTLACLDSLQRTDHEDLAIIVVDNGSREPPGALLRARFPDVTYVETGRNLGYAAGINVGIRGALERGATHVLALNNDTILDRMVIRQVLAAAHPDVAIVGAKVLRLDEPRRLCFAYGRVTYRQSLLTLVGEGATDGQEFATTRDVEFVHGCAVLLARAALERIGLFDEAFFAYLEDVDLCVRARAAGFRVVFAPDALVYHRTHTSTGGPGYVSVRQYLVARNTVLFARKHASMGQRARLVAWIVGTLPLQLARRLATREHHGVILKVRGYLDGLRDRPLPLEEMGLR
jgi:hypothetical protein